MAELRPARIVVIWRIIMDPYGAGESHRRLGMPLSPKCHHSRGRRWRLPTRTPDRHHVRGASRIPASVAAIVPVRYGVPQRAVVDDSRGDDGTVSRDGSDDGACGSP
jgi:hypothetical protein